MKGKKHAVKKAAVVFAVLFAAALCVFLPSLLAETKIMAVRGPREQSEPGGPESPPADTVFSVRAVKAENRDLQAYLEVNGNVINENQVAVFPDMGGRLISINVALGSRVWKGQTIAEVDPSKPGSSYAPSPVIAPISGTVAGAPLSVGATVSASSVIVTIADSQRLEIEASIPEREVGQLREGLGAEITLAAFPGEIFRARVSHVSPMVDAASRTKRIVLNFTAQDSRINAGMFASIKLKTRNYKNVIAVPAEAVVEARGLRGVYALDDSGERAHFHEIKAGVTVDGETEIRSGLEAGALVVVQGQQFLTDGAKVRVIGVQG
ncbi:MAG: efflux RND transporter periplasmic adaptor subunit [Treponema sp.]|jgi:multidrug efflux pump subunit AcrA (membrane-fusion protein)|nr:efflux RND transporter periplasmic adaptor subunit [Treponema sp.]